MLERVREMNNAELIGLAKNRFLPGDLQLAVAKTHYTRAQGYLAQNEGLKKSVRDWLWSDECNRGYSLKSVLIACNQFGASDTEKYWELYERYPSAWSRSRWRMLQAFIGSWWTPGESETPADLLNAIYDNYLCPKREEHKPHGWHTRGHLERIIKHKNADLKLAIKISQCGVSQIEPLGFQKIVELST